MPKGPLTAIHFLLAVEYRINVVFKEPQPKTS